MRARGLEPPRAFAHRLLRPACLPIPPRPRGCPERTSAARACIVMSAMPPAPTTQGQQGVIITHPNRDKPAVQATRAIVVVLLLVSVALVLVITIGGWSVLEGAIPMQIGYIVVYLTFAFFAARWNRGVLPISAALAVLLAIFALVAGPSWFDRNKSGFAQPALNAGLLGTADAAGRARADAAGGVRHARLLPGMERRAGAPRPGGRAGRVHRSAAAPGLSRTRALSLNRRAQISSLDRGHCGGGGTVDAGPSKGPVRKGVWVRFPPAASIDRLQRRPLRCERVTGRDYGPPTSSSSGSASAGPAPRGSPTAGARARAARARAGPRVRRSARRRRCPTA